MTAEATATEEPPVAWRDSEPAASTRLVRWLAAGINDALLDNSAVRDDGVSELLLHIEGLGEFRLRVQLISQLPAEAEVPALKLRRRQWGGLHSRRRPPRLGHVSGSVSTSRFGGDRFDGRSETGGAV